MKLGIDFGTCYSSAALLIDGVLRPVKEPLKPLESCFPSSVCVTRKGEIVISQAAENQRRLNPQGYQHHFKADLATGIPYFLGEESLKFMPEDLVTIMLAGLKQEAEKIINSSLDSAVITVPATYLINKKKLMEEAGNKAGFTEVTLLEEPVAAAIYYSQKGTMGHQVNEGDILLVYDLGGGTFDAALIQKKGNSYDLLCQPVGDQQCGGIYFDQVIAKDLIKQFDGDPVLELLNGHRQDKEAVIAKLNLLDWCRNFKHQLSVLDEHEDLPPFISSESYTLSREKFEKMISTFMDSSCSLCEQLVQQSGIKWDSINRILLVGGSCRIPYVKKRLEQQFQRPVVAIDDPELAICFGAAIYGDQYPENKIIETEFHRQSELKYIKNNQFYNFSVNELKKLNHEQFNHEAINYYRQAIQLNPNDVKLHHNLGYILYSQGQLEDAITEYKIALNLKQDNVIISHLRQAVAELELRQFRKENNLVALKNKTNVLYNKLCDLLAQRKWKDADQETQKIMLKVANQNDLEGVIRYLDNEAINKFPRSDLHILDSLWVIYSNGRFGFRIQRQIYVGLGGTNEYKSDIWQKFGEKVGWVLKKHWLIYPELTFDISAPIGHLPVAAKEVCWDFGNLSHFLRRIDL